MTTKTDMFTERERILIESFRILNSDLDLKTVIRNSLGIMIKRFGGQAASLIMVDLVDYSLKCHVASSNDVRNVISMPIKDSQSIAGWNSRDQAPSRIDNFDAGGEYVTKLRDSIGIVPGKILSAPLFAGGEFLGIVQILNDNDDRLTDESEIMLFDIIAERIALTLHNAWMLQEATRTLEEFKSLYDVGLALSKSQELDELLENILDNLKRVVDYDIGIVYLVDPKDHSISQLASRGVPEEERSKLYLKIGQGICGRVAETGKAIIVSDVSANTDYIAIRSQTRSEMAVPIEINNILIGVFNVESDLQDAYNNHHLELTNAFASMAAVSIEHARLDRERMTRRKMEHELSVARRIQMTFLPASDPVIDGIDLAGINIPSAEVGGDYYDFIPIVENQYGIAIGDVSGKGIPAALIMAAFRASLKAEIRNNFAIRAILLKVNNLLFESIERDRYVTAVYGVLDSKSGIFTYSNAGHNPPILRRSSGEVEFLREGGVALGALKDSQYQERPVSLRAGDILLLYTDGVTEFLNEKGHEFGVDRLLAALNDSHELKARDIIESIVNKTAEFGAERKYSDDFTMIVIKAL